MQLKNITLAGIAALTLAAVPSVANAQFDRRNLEAVAALVLANKLGISASGVIALNNRTDESIFDLAPVLQMQRNAPRSTANQIWELRRKGLGWGEIAKRVGIQPGQFNQMRNRGDFDRDRIWRDALSNGFTPRADIDWMRKMGLSWADVMTASVISRESGSPVNEVVRRFQTAGDWRRVTDFYRIDDRILAERADRWKMTGSMPSEWSGSRRSRGEDRFEDRRDEKIKSNNGQGKGKGSGKSKGKGKGRG